MSQNITQIKKDMDTKLLELRSKRKSVIAQFKKRIAKAKIDQLTNSILSK